MKEITFKKNVVIKRMVMSKKRMVMSKKRMVSEKRVVVRREKWPYSVIAKLIRSCKKTNNLD